MIKWRALDLKVIAVVSKNARDCLINDFRLDEMLNSAFNVKESEWPSLKPFSS
jgi:hypothetical protein